MFVIQDYPICYDDFDANRRPYVISCGKADLQVHFLYTLSSGLPNSIQGHVFCRTYLDTLSSTSRNCPICRVAFRPWDIRIVICTLRSKQEDELWKRLKNGFTGDSERESLV